MNICVKAIIAMTPLYKRYSDGIISILMFVNNAAEYSVHKVTLFPVRLIWLFIEPLRNKPIRRYDVISDGYLEELGRPSHSQSFYAVFTKKSL